MLFIGLFKEEKKLELFVYSNFEKLVMLICFWWSENNVCYVVVLLLEIWKIWNGLYGFCFSNYFFIYDKVILGNVIEI